MVLLTIFLRLGLLVLIESLCDIFNLSIVTGVFPDSWKIARVASFSKVVKSTINLIMGRFQYFRLFQGFREVYL